MLKAFVHPANEHDKRGGEALLLGMDLSLWPRVRKLFVDWGYRGLKGLASSLGLELEVVARPYAGVRGVWVREGEDATELPRERGFKPLHHSLQIFGLCSGCKDSADEIQIQGRVAQLHT